MIMHVYFRPPLHPPRCPDFCFLLHDTTEDAYANGVFGESVIWSALKAHHNPDRWKALGYQQQATETKFGHAPMIDFIKRTWWANNVDRIDSDQLLAWPDEWDRLGPINSSLKRHAFEAIQNDVAFYQQHAAELADYDPDQAQMQMAIKNLDRFRRLQAIPKRKVTL